MRKMLSGVQLVTPMVSLSGSKYSKIFTMNTFVYFSLAGFKQLCGETFIDTLHEKRKQLGECSRTRCIGTLEILWLLVGVAVHSQLKSLAEIIQRVQTNDFNRRTLSVAAYCKARDAFSPESSALLLG